MDKDILKLATLLAENLDYEYGVNYKEIDHNIIFISDIYNGNNGTINISQCVAEYFPETKQIELKFVNRGIYTEQYLDKPSDENNRALRIELFIENGMYTQYLHERLKPFLVYKSEYDYVRNRIMYIIKGCVNYSMYPIESVKLFDSISGKNYEIPINFLSFDQKSQLDTEFYINSMMNIVIQNIVKYDDMELLNGSMKVINTGNNTLSIFHTFESKENTYKINYDLIYNIGIGMDMRLNSIGIVMNGYLINYIYSGTSPYKEISILNASYDEAVVDHTEAVVMKELIRILKDQDKLPYESLKEYFVKYNDEFSKIMDYYGIEEKIIFGNDIKIFTAKNGFTRIRNKSFIVKINDA